MTNQEIVATLIKAFESLGIPYMLVGSFSTTYYSMPRSTKDADFVVQLGDTPISAVMERLGSGFRLDPQMSFESVTGTYRHTVERVDSAFTVELFLLGDDPHDQERFARRSRVQTPQGEAYLPTPEDVIVTKLRWAFLAGRTKDRDDARNVIAVQGAALDWDYINRWCDQHGTRPLLDEVRQSIPPI